MTPYWARPARQPAGDDLLAELDHMAEARHGRRRREATRRPSSDDGTPRDRLGDLVGLLLCILGAAVAVAVVLAVLLVEVP